MGCRTRVMGNVHDRNQEITFGRGNLSFTSINLPRSPLTATKTWNGSSMNWSGRWNWYPASS